MTSPIWRHCLWERYCYEWDIASDGLPARCACLQDINYNWMPISSSITYPDALLFARYSYQRDIATSEILLPARYCYQRDIATSEILLPARYCYQQDIATSEILLPARYCYQWGIASDDIDSQWDMTADEIWLLARYDYQRDIRAWTILAITWCPIPVISPSRRYWQPARYDCYRYLRDIAPYEILLLARYCYLREMATCEILLPTRYGY